MKPGTNGNLFDLLRTHWSTAPDRHFLVTDDGDALTYRDVDARSGQFATALRMHGAGVGDRVVVQIDKSTDAVALYLACLRLGVVYVPLNTAYTHAEVAYFLEDAEAVLYVHEDGSGHDQETTSISITDLAQQATDCDPWLGVEIRLADDLAAMLYTSGTTGRSKGAMLTHANLTSNALSLHAIWRFIPGDVLLHILPIYHVHGLFVALHTAMLNASTVFFCSRFVPDRVIELLPQSTVMMGVPTHYARLLDHDDFSPEKCRNIRLFTSGSAPMTEQLHEAVQRQSGQVILERYGMTETGMITSNPYDGERIPGTVGFPLPGVRIRVVDEAGEPCDPGAPGVVEVQGPNVFAGYWRLPERTAAEHHDGWFVTGDVGFVDEEGRLTLEGRKGDMIISGGLNVYPREVELVLDTLPGVVESAVVGVPDDDFGERVVAALVLTADSALDTDEIDSAVRQSLAPFKVPRTYVALPELPRNSMGKVQKTALRGNHDLWR